MAAGTSDVTTLPADALAVGRGRQVDKPGWAASFHERKRALRESKGRKPKKED